MAMESNIYALWAGKQAAKGTALAAPSTRFIQVAGSLDSNREDANENWSDLDRFGGATDWVNNINGGGTAGIEATPNELGWILWAFFGGETVTGTTPNFIHTFTPSAVGGFWTTWWQLVGNTQSDKRILRDCKISSLTIEGSTGAKAVRVTPTIMSLDAGEKFVTNPTPGMPTDQRVFLYTEGSSSYTVDGTIITGTSQFSFTINENLAYVTGDDVTPNDLVPGTASIDIAVTLQLDANGLAQYNKIIYGSASPAAGAKPLKKLGTIGSWACLLAKDANTSLGITIPSVKWSPDLSMAPNPDGGAVELALAGSMRKITGTQACTIVVKNGSAAYTA